MTVYERNKSPDFFEDDHLDPVSAATRSSLSAKSAPAPKKKAGFYLSQDLIERFNRQFHRMKLSGAPIENKSALLEMALQFALEDIEKGTDSLLLRAITNKSNR